METGLMPAANEPDQGFDGDFTVKERPEPYISETEALVMAKIDMFVPYEKGEERLAVMELFLNRMMEGHPGSYKQLSRKSTWIICVTERELDRICDLVEDGGIFRKREVTINRVR